MDFFGSISTRYGRGVVKKGRRTQAEVYHADPSDAPGTKLRFNLYEGANPEEFAVRKDKSGKWFIHNKTQTRERRKDLPAEKPSYKEVDVNSIDAGNDRQALMPKLDGSHAIIDLKAGRSPRVFSYRVAKRAPTGLIEHTHKMPELLKQKVPKELDRTILRAELMGMKGDKAIPAEALGGFLNAKVWSSRRAQAEKGVKLKPFPFDVVTYRGRPMVDAPFSEKREILEQVAKSLSELDLPELAVTPDEKIDLMNSVRSGTHPLTDEGFVLVNKDQVATPVKAVLSRDFDVHVRDIRQGRSGDGSPLDRAGAVGYSWTSDGPIVGTVGGFKHDEAKDMLRNPDRYVGRVAKVKARKAFKGDGPMFQPRFKEWHLDKGEIEKAAFLDELEKISALGYAPRMAIGAGLGSLTGAAMFEDRLRGALAGGLAGAGLGATSKMLPSLSRRGTPTISLPSTSRVVPKVVPPKKWTAGLESAEDPIGEAARRLVVERAKIGTMPFRGRDEATRRVVGALEELEPGFARKVLERVGAL
jgi:hypothetical protein